MSPRPPAWARRLAARLVRGPMREFVIGDLEEMYARVHRERGARRAGLAYLRWVLLTATGRALEVAVAGVGGDVRTALRHFRREPRVFVVGALVLTVGLGIATLTWGVRYGASGRDLPVRDADRVVGLRVLDERGGWMGDLSVQDAEAVMASVESVDAVGLWVSESANLGDGVRPPERVSAWLVTSALFTILEAHPAHGRLLTPGDGASGAARVAVLGYRFWEQRYGGDPTVVGRTIRLDGEPTVVVGVLAEGLGITAHEDVWLPAGAHEDRGAREYNAFARLRPGAEVEALESDLTRLSGSLARQGLEEWRERSLVVTAFDDSGRQGVPGLKDRLLASAGVLLLIMALANVANLFLVHTRRRARELTTRRALGAGRLELVRLLCLEAALPALLGFAGAALVAAWTLAWYQRASDAYGVGYVWQVYRLEAPHLVLLAGAALASTLFVSVAAGLRELRGDGGEILRAGRGNTADAFRFGQVLLGVEVAVGAALFLVASLTLRSAWNLRTHDYGFATEAVMTGDLTLRGAAYDAPDERLRFWNELQESLTALPGVQEAAVGAQLPMIRCCGSVQSVEVEGWQLPDRSELPRHYVNPVSPTYFATFETPVLSGREFDSSDGVDAEPVALVNVPFADRYFPAASPLGRRLRVWQGDEPGPWRRVVGLAPHLWMDTDVNDMPEGVYVPLAQSVPARASVALRVGGSPDGYGDLLRRTVMAADPELPVDDVRTMPQLIRQRTSLYRREGPLFALVGATALLLAIAGLYAVVSYMASMRTAELGVRAAMGASRADLMGRSVGGAAVPTLVGAGVGMAVGLTLTRGLDRFFFLVDPWSPGVAAVSVAVLVASALAASLAPAWRVSRVDLVRVLRAE